MPVLDGGCANATVHDVEHQQKQGEPDKRASDWEHHGDPGYQNAVNTDP